MRQITSDGDDSAPASACINYIIPYIWIGQPQQQRRDLGSRQFALVERFGDDRQTLSLAAGANPRVVRPGENAVEFRLRQRPPTTDASWRANRLEKLRAANAQAIGVAFDSPGSQPKHSQLERSSHGALICVGSDF
jgi:hypothetical protein